MRGVGAGVSRRVQYVLGGLLAVLVVAIVVVLIAGGKSDGPRSGASPVAAGVGGYLTASQIPRGLRNRPVPSFALADARGGTFSSRQLKGRPYVLTFLCVHCVDVCPLIGTEIHQALAALGPAAKNLNVVAFSVDPQGDTRPAVRRWLAQHREPANFHYLIGSGRQLAPVWRAFYVSPQTPGDPTSSHTAVIWLIERTGGLAALIAAGVPIDPRKLAHDFRTLLHAA